MSELAISSLDEAVTLYSDTKRGLLFAGTVSPRILDLKPHYFEQEHQIGDRRNEYDMLVKKQEERREWMGKKPLCVVMRQPIKNPLGLPDNHYHYMFYRKKLSNRWADSLGSPSKYRASPGFFLPYPIFRHAMDHKTVPHATLVLVLGDGRIYTCGMEKALKHFDKQKIILFVNPWGQETTGLPLELFEPCK